MKWFGRQARAAPIPLVAAVFAIILAPAGLLLWRILPTHTPYYTDADTIRVPTGRAPLREILWQPAKPVPGALGERADEYEPKVSPDGQTLYFVRGRAGHNADIYFRKATAKGWSDAAPLAAVNTDADELGPELSPDGQSLYFYSDREGGIGGYDIWVSHLSDGQWQPPFNLGPSVNSTFNEYGAAITPDGAALFFSSNRPRPGEAPPRSGAWPATLREDLSHHDYDIYSSSLDGDVVGAARPIPALNTPFNEGAPAVSPAGDFLYFASDRPGGLGGFDIYRSRLRRSTDGLLLEAPINLGNAVNSASNDLDPAVTMGGFAIYFSSDRGVSGEGADAPAYALYRSQSREVFREVETTQASINWRSLLPFLWLLIFLLTIPLLAWLLVRTGRSDGFHRLSLLAKCLLVSLMIHALILLGFGFWRVGGAVAGVLRRTGGTRIAITSGASEAGTTGSISEQLRSGLSDSPLKSIPAPGALRPEFTTTAAAATPPPTNISPGAVRIALSREPVASGESDAPLPVTAPASPVVSAPAPSFEEVQLPSPRTNSPARTSEPVAQLTIGNTGGLAAPLARPLSPQPTDAQRSVNPAVPLAAVKIDELAGLAPEPAHTADAPASPSVVLDRQTLQRLSSAADRVALPAPASEPRGSTEGTESITPERVSAPARPAVTGLPAPRTAGSPPSGAPSAQVRAAPMPLPHQGDAAAPSPQTDASSPKADLLAGPIAPAQRVQLALPTTQTPGPSDAPGEHTAPLTVASAPLPHPGVTNSAPAGRPAPPRNDDGVAGAVAVSVQPFQHAEEMRGDAPVAAASPTQTAATPKIAIGPSPALALPRDVEPGQREGAAHAEMKAAPAIAEAPQGQHPAIPAVRGHRADARSAALPPGPAISVGAIPLEPTRNSDAPPPTGRRDAPAQFTEPPAPIPSGQSIALALPTETAPTSDPFAQRAPEVRQPLLERMGGGADTERAVNLALDWLAHHQSRDGRWSSTSFDDDCGECGGESNVRSDAAATGLALLCFLGADHTHTKDGPYRDTVERAIQWLVARQSSDGDLRASETMYSQGIAAIALAEALGMTHDPTLREPVEKAVEFIGGARSRAGGWRYVPGQPGDTSVLGWQAMALSSARRAGVTVPDELFQAASGWLDRVEASGKPGQYCYQVGSAPSVSMTAEGLFVQQLLGHKRDEPMMQASVAFISRHPPNWTSQASTYYWYYATLALFQQQGPAWESWNTALKKQLLVHQRRDGPPAGSWDPTDRYSKVGGRVYQTAVCTLCLEVYYRYLPMYGPQEP